MRFLGNVLWFIFGGFLLALMWAMAGVLCCITIIGIPVGLQCFKFAEFVLHPFGRHIEYTSSVGKVLVNILWIFIFGWELAVASVAIGLCWCVTIVGIPFGIQFIKFAGLALMPFGAEIEEDL